MTSRRHVIPYAHKTGIYGASASIVRDLSRGTEGTFSVTGQPWSASIVADHLGCLSPVQIANLAIFDYHGL